LGTADNCGLCGTVCNNTVGSPYPEDYLCCPLIGFPDPAGLLSMSYGCFDTYINRNYCGPTCADCTLGGLKPDGYCCRGVCTTIRDDETACGCDGECAVDSLCCIEPEDLTDDLPSNYRCTPLQTNDNCAACGNACGDFLCCPNSPLTSNCTNPLTDNKNCGSCGRVCSSTETCCDGECTDITSLLNCGGCGNLCNTGEFCCDQPGIGFGCQPYLNSNGMCGCPAALVNCTALPPPAENFAGTFQCCQGQCVPVWQDCTD